jgi:STE20-like kinase
MEQRCNVIRKHVRDFFYLQRHLMLSKQEKDLEHLRQLNVKLEEDLIRRQNEEKRLFLKSLRQEQRSRREMYRRSLYIVPAANAIDSTKISPDEEKRKIKEFEEREKERFENEIQRLTIRHMKQLEEYRIKADNIMKDLDDEQRLKRKQLVDAETKCLKDVDDRYNQEYGYWQNRLRSRKQKLEEDFKKEDAERSHFYQNVLNLNSSNGNNYGTTSPNPNYYTQSHMSNASSIGSSSSSSYSGLQAQPQYYYTMNQQGMNSHAQNQGYGTLNNGMNGASPSLSQQQMTFNGANGTLSMSNGESYFNPNNSNLGQYITQGNAPMHRKGNEF